jgi:ATP-dependent 26S proteasome regulatory subunit
LLSGPPGTGKTSIARTLAAQSRCSFYPLTPADITSKWVGEAEQNIKRIFERARENSPSIVFIDEIDAVAAERGSGAGTVGTERLLTQLLAEIDGVGTGPRRVFVVAATNRPDILDPALTRGGRLSRTIDVPLPDAAGRHKLLDLHARGVPLSPEVDLAEIAAATAGFSGGDVRALVQQAGVHAYGRSAGTRSPTVDAADFRTAIDALRVGKTTSPRVPQPPSRGLLSQHIGNRLTQSWPSANDSGGS